MMNWLSSQMKMIKVYKPDKPSDWSGIHWHGNTTMVPRDFPKCGWQGQWCELIGDSNKTIVTVLIISCCIMITVFIFGIVFFARKYHYEAVLKEVDKIIIPWAYLSDFQVEGPNEESDETAKYRHKHIMKVTTAVYQQKKVILKSMRQTNIDYHKREILVELKHMQELVHENICAFVGIFTNAEHMCIVMSYEHRGSVRDTIQDEMIHLSWDFKMSIIIDLASGLQYLHHSHVGYHGTLTSSKCVIDNRWTCKITGNGLHQIRSASGDVHPYQLEEENKYYKLLWVAPELLNAAQGQVSGTKKGDTYSLGIIMQEVILEAGPYAANEPRLTPQVIIHQLREGQSLRPAIPAECCSEGWAQLMEACWKHDPDQRANAGTILHTIFSIYHGKSMDLVDNMLKRLESYANNLEERVADKTKDLIEEKNKLDTLLSELLPQSIVTQLMKGKHIEPEAFDNITLLFSDIVDFTRISSETMPLDIVEMLNSMYSLFDGLTHQFDVYKVATIGDAYMVASGVPIRNGDKHAEEICKLAITLIDCIKDVSIPHLPERHLKMRIGIHSGPCVAGVVPLVHISLVHHGIISKHNPDLF